ncbi:MAG: hypothetical protein Q8O67_32645 [Deltaproteobacteria bacterium]|nr:hypothetical protein [Deltaproteobacteria bacterium]
MRDTLRTIPLLLALAMATPSRAVGVSVLGTGVEVDEVGYLQLAQLVALLQQGASSIETARSALDQGRETLSTLREINAAVGSTVFLAQHPDEVLRQARENFLLSFTELEAINREAIALKEEMRAGPTGFDANTYRRAFNSTRNTLTGFELFLAAREKDYGALTEMHLRRTAGIEATLSESRQVQAKVNATTSLSQKEAAAISAKANADTAVAAGVTAQSASDMLRLMTLKSAQEERERFDAEARAAARKEAALKAARARTDAAPAAELPLAESDDLSANDVSVRGVR